MPTRESAEASKQERKTRHTVPGEVCCSERGQVGIPGLSPLPHQHSDRGGEEKGGGTTRLCPYDAEDVGYKGRCHIWTVMSPAQDHLTSSLLMHFFAPVFFCQI